MASGVSGITFADFKSYATNGTYNVFNGAWAVFRETARWLGQPNGLKNLVARPLDLVPRWATIIPLSMAPNVIRLCAQWSHVKVAIGAIEAISKFETDVIGTPKETKEYVVITTSGKGVASVTFGIEELMIRKVGMLASWMMSSMELVMYLRNSSLLNLGVTGLTRVSWIATVSGTAASVQGLFSEGKFLYKASIATYHDVYFIKLDNKVVTQQATGYQVAREELANSLLKLAIHVSCLALAICFAMPLLGIAFKSLQTAKIVALTAMTVFTIISHYWEGLVIGNRKHLIEPLPSSK